MQTAAIGQSAAASAKGNADSFGQMKSEDFFKLLISELRQQDPLEPNKTSDMIAQVSQIRGIELSSQLTDTLKSVAEQQRGLGAAGLIGKYVEGSIAGADGSKQTVSGVVTAVTLGQDGRTTLELDSGVALPATDVTRIGALDQSGSATPSGVNTSASSAVSASGASAATAKPPPAAKPSWLNFATSLQL